VILYFLRHAEADPGDDGRLTAAGADLLRAAAPVWRSLNLRPETAITSPLPRAVQTAELIAEALELSTQPVVDDRMAPGADWGAMARSVADHGASRSALFIGHEPDLSGAVQLLTGAASVRMRKGGMACVEFYGVPEPSTGELAWLLDPDLYTGGGGDR
jgi:phosphohistidine phosphatase